MVNLSSHKDIPLQFVTPRLHVRRYAPQDEDSLFAAAHESIAEMYPYLPWCHPQYSLNDARSWISTVSASWNNREAYSFLLKDKTTGVVVGGAGLNQVDEHCVANLGYWVRSSETGKGYASEAAMGLADYGFRHLGLHRIEIIMSTRNIASKKVASSTGATLEGTARNRLFLHGENHDAYVYSLIPSDIQTGTDP